MLLDQARIGQPLYQGPFLAAQLLSLCNPACILCTFARLDQLDQNSPCEFLFFRPQGINNMISMVGQSAFNPGDFFVTFMGQQAILLLFRKACWRQTWLASPIACDDCS